MSAMDPWFAHACKDSRSCEYVAVIEEPRRENEVQEGVVPGGDVDQRWSRDESGRLGRTVDHVGVSHTSGGDVASHQAPVNKEKGPVYSYPPQEPVRTHVDSPPPRPYSVPPQYQAIPSGSQSPSSLATFKEEIQNFVRETIAASSGAPKSRSVTSYCKLPAVIFPQGFKAPKYRRYDGTSDPHHHVSGFVMDSHQYLYDKALLVHLFQKSLEGEALHWFTSLSALELSSFDTVAERFIEHFSYLAHQSPTLCELVAEKMKPDEDFIVFANRWRTMASRSEVMIPESQAVAMLVTNTTPQLRGILMFSELRSFQQLYNRAKVVQAQIKESMIPNIFESKPPRGRKPASVPTTEGVTINEQVNAFHNPPGRPPYKPHPAPTPAYTPPSPQPGPYLHPAPVPSPTFAY